MGLIGIIGQTWSIGENEPVFSSKDAFESLRSENELSTCGVIMGEKSSEKRVKMESKVSPTENNVESNDNEA